MAPKSKNQKMSLGTFLGDQSLGSWADEMEDMPTPTSSDHRSGYGSERRGFNSLDFGAARDRDGGLSSRPSYPPREPLPMPTKPPFTAHLANLSFEVTSTDVEQFFDGCAVSNVRIVEDKIDRRPKGFGYVEFDTLDGLKEALSRSNQQFLGRTIKVSVADPPKDRGEARELNDWTRKGPLPELPAQGRRTSERGGYTPSEGGMERGGSRRGPSEAGDGKPRDFGNWERKGPLSPVPGAAAPAMGAEQGGRIRRNDASFERRNVASWGEGRPERPERPEGSGSGSGSRPPRREFQEKPPAPERVPTAAELDNQWRSKMKPDAAVESHSPTPEPSLPSSPVATQPPPAVRPRLNLQKPSGVRPAEVSDSAPADPTASPFGAARPIDTAAREREIEEKLALQRQKKEAELKAEQEKRAADKAAKAAEKAERAASGPSDAKNAGTSDKQGKEDQENGSDETKRGNFEILRRATDQEDQPDAENEEAANGEALENGVLPADKEVKPKEVVRDANGQQNTETTAEALEEDGWSTVPTGKRGKRGGQRALAS